MNICFIPPCIYFLNRYNHDYYRSKKPYLSKRKMRESIRYLQNAKEILAGVPIEGNSYTDVKPVREAFGTAYLAILEAVKEALLKKGLIKKVDSSEVALLLKNLGSINLRNLFLNFKILY